MGNFFRSVLGAAKAKLQAKVVNPSTSAFNVNPDSGYDGLSQVAVNAISPQRTNGTAANTSGTDGSGPYVYFPYGWYPQANTNGSFIRMTQAQAQAAHSHTGTRATVTSNGTIDLGDKHSIRYVPVNIPISLTTRRLTTENAWIRTQNTGYSSTVDTGSLRQHGFCANLKVGDKWADWTVSGTLYIQGSTNNSSWVNLTSTTFSVYASLVQKELSAVGNYRYFRVAVSSTHWRESHNVALDELVIAFT